MADITVQIVLSALQTAGLLVGIFYYLMTLRNSQRNIRLVEQSRQLQYLLQMTSMATLEGSKMFYELQELEWTDYDDFERKYGSDHDISAKMNVIFGQYDVIGQALKRELVDRDLVFERYGVSPLILWGKFADYVKELRRRFNDPSSAQFIEYLAEENLRYCKEKDIDTTEYDHLFSE